MVWIGGGGEFVEFSCAVEGGLDVGHDVFAAEVVEEAGLAEEF